MVKKRNSNWASYTIYIILFLILLAVSGLIQFVSADFDFSAIMTATYWLKTASGAGSGLGAFIIFALFRRDTKVSKDETYNEDLEELETTIKGNVGPDFPEFTELETREFKKQAWILKMEMKLQRKTGRMSSRVLKAKRLIEKQDERFLNSRNPFKILLKAKAQRKINRINKLKLQKTAAWVEENIDYVRIKHASITQGEIINGQKGPSNPTKLINNNPLGYIFRERIPVILFMTAIQGLYNALIIFSGVSTMAMWLAIIFQLLTIFINVAIGINYGNTLFQKIDKNNLMVRKNFLMKYLMWTKKKDK